MRVTENMRFNTTVYNLFNSQYKYNDIMEKIATRKNVNRASDDPIAATKILDIRRGKAAIEQYKQNMEFSSSWIAATESTLSGAYDLLATATGIATGSLGADAATMELAAANIQDIIASMRSLANTKWGDRYLFSGTREDVAPFPADPSVATIEQAQEAAGNTFAGTVTSSGTYTGDTNSTYALKIVTPGAFGTAKYQKSADGGRTWEPTIPADTPVSGIIPLYEGVSLTFTNSSWAANDIFYVNAAPAGYYQGNDENLSINIDRATSYEYSLTGAEVFTAAGAGGVDIFTALADLHAALTSDAVANTTGGTTPPTPIDADTLIKNIDGYTGYQPTDYIQLDGTKTDGSAVSAVNIGNISATTTVGELLSQIESTFGAVGAVTAFIASDGKLKVTDNTSGASLLTVRITVKNTAGTDDGTLIFNDGQTFFIDQQKVLSDKLTNLENAQTQILLNQSFCGTKAGHIEVVKNNVTAFDESLTSLLSEAQDANITELAVRMSAQELAMNEAYAIAAKIGENTILNFLK